MQATYRLNESELTQDCLEGLKATFRDQEIEIIVHTLDETDYLLKSEANKEKLLAAKSKVDQGKNLVVVQLENLTQTANSSIETHSGNQMPSNPADLIIRNGDVIDGAGRKRMRADVAIAGDHITAIGDLSHLTAEQEIDATGRIVAPGFIDVHTHDDRLLLSHPAMTPKLSQGVTTVITGNCGISLAPLQATDRPPPPLDLLGDRPWYRFATFAEYFAALEAEPPAINCAALVGHSTLRVAAMADVRQPATAEEIESMRSLLQAALEAGAIGFSTGLFYPTNKPAPPAEVIALAELLAPVGGIYTTHMRDEADDVEKSLEETFATAQAAGVPVIISHHKCSGRANWGRSGQTLQTIDQA